MHVWCSNTTCTLLQCLAKHLVRVRPHWRFWGTLQLPCCSCAIEKQAYDTHCGVVGLHPNSETLYQAPEQSAAMSSASKRPTTSLVCELCSVGTCLWQCTRQVQAISHASCAGIRLN